MSDDLASMKNMSVTEIMSAASALMWKAGVEEDSITAYCNEVRTSPTSKEALVITKKWLDA